MGFWKTVKWLLSAFEDSPTRPNRRSDDDGAWRKEWDERRERLKAFCRGEERE